MVLKEVAMYKIVNNFGNNGWFGWNFDTIWVPIRVPLVWIAPAYQPYCGSYSKLCVFLTLCQICSYRCTMGTIGRFGFENLNFNGWNLFWLGFDGVEARMLDLYRFMQWSWKESEWSWKNHICPCFDHVACNLIKRGVMVLKENQDPLLLPCECRIRAKMAVFVQGNDLNDCLWLGIH